MELDKRIIEGKKPLFCLDTEEAKQFIGKEGYFTDVMVAFTDISRNKTSVLTAIDEEAQSCFKDVDGVRWDWFLPSEWVKEPKKKYRPLSFKEFWRLFDVGDGVCFKRKGQDTAEFLMFLGYEIDSDENRDEIPGEGKVNIGGNRYTLAELFEYYEMQLNDEWQPFGIEIKE